MTSRGRGRAALKPAWMTTWQQQVPGGNVEGGITSTTTTESRDEAKDNATTSATVTKPPVLPIGGGRGRGSLTPNWLTSQGTVMSSNDLLNSTQSPPRTHNAMMVQASSTPEFDEIYEGIVSRVHSFGSFVALRPTFPSVEVLVPVTDKDFPQQATTVGEEVRVRMVRATDGRLAGSLRGIPQLRGSEPTSSEPPPPLPTIGSILKCRINSVASHGAMVQPVGGSSDAEGLLPTPLVEIDGKPIPLNQNLEDVLQEGFVIYCQMVELRSGSDGTSNKPRYSMKGVDQSTGTERATLRPQPVLLPSPSQPKLTHGNVDTLGRVASRDDVMQNVPLASRGGSGTGRLVEDAFGEDKKKYALVRDTSPPPPPRRHHTSRSRSRSRSRSPKHHRKRSSSPHRRHHHHKRHRSISSSASSTSSYKHHSKKKKHHHKKKKHRHRSRSVSSRSQSSDEEWRMRRT